MPDRYDPKVSVRSTGYRKPAEDSADPSSPDTDPLAELARIVSGRSTPGSPAAPARSRTVPAATPAKPAPEIDILGDLEAELLSDLQASFASVKRPAKTPPPPPPEPPPAPPQARQQDVAPPAKPVVAPTGAPPPPTPQRPPPLAAARPPAVPPPPADVTPEKPAAGSPPTPPAGRQEPATAPAVRPAAAGDRAETAEAQPRSTPPVDTSSGPIAPTQPPRQQHPRWARPPEPAKPEASSPSRFAPPKATPLQAPPAQEFDEDEVFGQAAHFPEPAGEGAEAAEAFPLDGFDTVPGYGDEDQLPPYPEEELHALVGRRRMGRGLALLVGVLAVALAGSVALIVFRSNSDSGAPPPIISADASPTKITPDDTGLADGDQQSKLIYDRVDTGEGDPDTTLLAPGEDPIDAIPPARSGDDAITRVIIPGGPGIDRPVDADGGPDQPADDGLAGSAGTDAIEPIGPRRVRTVIVKPDGTIVSNDATDPGVPAESPAAAPLPMLNQPAAASPNADDTIAIAGPGAGTGSDLEITPVPDEATDGGALPALPALEPEPEPSPPAPPAPQPAPPPQQPTIVATGGDRGPIDLTPGRPAQSPQQQAAVTGGGMMVQVSSQRSDESARATFRDLQQRYAGILGPYEVNVQRADLGDRGIYFRARVGPFAAADAQRLCDDLKAAGGDCILAQN